MINLKIKSSIWHFQREANKEEISIFEIVPGAVIVQPKGSMSSESVEALFNFLDYYSIGIKSKVDLVIDIKSITSISCEARATLIGLVKTMSPVNRIISYGSNIFIQNVLQVLISIIANKGKEYKNFYTIEEAVDWIKSK